MRKELLTLSFPFNDLFSLSLSLSLSLSQAYTHSIPSSLSFFSLSLFLFLSLSLAPSCLPTLSLSLSLSHYYPPSLSLSVYMYNRKGLSKCLWDVTVIHWGSQQPQYFLHLALSHWTRGNWVKLSQTMVRASYHFPPSSLPPPPPIPNCTSCVLASIFVMAW